MRTNSSIANIFFLVSALFVNSISAQAESGSLKDLYPLAGQALAERISAPSGNIQTKGRDEEAISSLPEKLMDTFGLERSASAAAAPAAGKDEVVAMHNPFAPNNTIDSLNGATFNEEIIEASIQESDMAVTMYTLGGADPLALHARQSASNFGFNMVDGVEAVDDRNHRELSAAGQAGEMFKMGLRNCVLEKTKEATQAGEKEGKKIYPQWLCQNSRTGAGTGAGGGGGGNPFGLRSTTTRASLALRAAGGASADLQKCGFTSENLTADGASCDSEASGKVGSGTLIAAARLSYMLFPEGGGTNQKERRTEYRETFGDKCYVCVKGGEDSFNNTLDESAISLKVVDIEPEKKVSEKFNETHRAVYNNLAMILDARCKSVAWTAAFNNGNKQKGTEIFRVKDDVGTVPASWDDGDFWRSNKALTETFLPGGITVDKALGYMSFNGFRLTPPIMDAIYKVTIDKGTIPSGTMNYKPCQEFEGYMDFDLVKAALQEEAGRFEPVKKQIKSLFFFALRLAVGKTFDSCEQIIAKTSIVPLMPGMTEAAIGQVLKICTGDVNNSGAFAGLRSENLGALSAYLDELNKEIAYTSGKSGASVASSFKGEKAASQKSGLN